MFTLLAHIRKLQDSHFHIEVQIILCDDHLIVRLHNVCTSCSSIVRLEIIQIFIYLSINIDLYKAKNTCLFVCSAYELNYFLKRMKFHTF